MEQAWIAVRDCDCTPEKVFVVKTTAGRIFYKHREDEADEEMCDISHTDKDIIIFQDSSSARIQLIQWAIELVAPASKILTHRWVSKKRDLTLGEAIDYQDGLDWLGQLIAWEE